MKKRAFNKALLAGGVGFTGASLLAGCVSRISEDARDKEKGEPYRCTKCGYLTRSKTDLTGTRCPRCHAKKMVKISEEEMAEYLAEQ
ncbi:MAG: hypothetical protein U9P12_02805 [Verrucomicrobiota bacterium]|nr:hypothetical protein [Verrucomicrobiota bacterium]